MWLRRKKDGPLKGLLADRPISRPGNWGKLVDEPQGEKEWEALRCSRRRGRPYGDGAWAMTTARRLGIESSLRDIGRPKKAVRE
jgi:hypothetical protein